jgi:cysteine desulfurase
MSLNGGKIYGPKQSGALFVKSGVRLTPLIYGGGQERGIRSGTENVAAIAGFTTALKLVQEKRHTNSQKTLKLQQYFIEQLQENFKSSIINGSLKHRIVNNIHVTFPTIDNETLLIKLDNEGIMAAAGSACSAASTKPSSVLAAVGLSDTAARSSIRFSLGKGTTKAEIDYAVSSLKKLLA